MLRSDIPCSGHTSFSAAGRALRDAVEPDHVRAVLHRHEQELTVRVPGRAGPVRAAAGDGIDDRSRLARRREESVVAQLRERLAAGLADARASARRDPPRRGAAARAAAEPSERAGSARSARRARRSAGTGRSSTGKSGCAGLAIEHEHEAGLGRLHHGVDRAARRARGARGWAAPRGRSPRDRGARSGSASGARRCARRAPRPSPSRGSRRAGRRRSSRGSAC